MRLFFTSALLIAASASQASAQVTYSSQSSPTGDPGTAQTIIANFNTAGSAANSGLLFEGNYAFRVGSTGQAATPAGNANTNGYFAVPGTLANPCLYDCKATINFKDYIAANGSISSLSFYWGSIDTYNTLEVLNSAGVAQAFFGLGTSLNGINVGPPANGDQGAQATNRRLTLDFAGISDFEALRFTSTSYAFEIDDIAVTTVDRVEVPEPATLSMLTFGIAMLGVAGARRKRVSSTI
jgi:hypothetical protein